MTGEAMTRVLVYARYSSDLQRDSSIDDQIRICRARADREGWSIAEIFTDHAISGATVLRPGYQAMLAYLRKPGADVVLAESLDRFSRDQEHIAAFFKQASFAGARIYTLSEGDVSEIHIGLRGSMSAIYLKDLAAKTRRGLEGRIRAGRCIGMAPYGYRAIRRLAPNGEAERGLREIDPAQAIVVRRIFADYAAGLSPRSIAKALNEDAIPGPRGGIWYDTAIRGRSSRGDGLLRNALYAGRLVWNRQRNTKNPIDGTRVRRTNPVDDVVVHHVPDLAIVDAKTWQSAQDRLALEAAPVESDGAASSSGRFWERRRPRSLLSSKVFCGICGRSFFPVGRDYLACRAAHQDACTNTARPRRSHLEAHVLDALGRQLMQPDLVDAFIEEFTRTWTQALTEGTGNIDRLRRELQSVERRTSNLIDALADGLRAPDIQKRLADLEHRRVELDRELATPIAALPMIPGNLAAVYREKLTRLRQALAGPDHTEALETARALVDRIIITPPADPGEPLGIELVGNLAKMLKAGGLPSNASNETAVTSHILTLVTSSVKGGPGALPLEPTKGLCPLEPSQGQRPLEPARWLR